MKLEEEEKEATKLLKGKVVFEIKRIGAKEVLVQFEDGTRFYIDQVEGGLDLSITGTED